MIEVVERLDKPGKYKAVYVDPVIETDLIGLRKYSSRSKDRNYMTPDPEKGEKSFGSGQNFVNDEENFLKYCAYEIKKTQFWKDYNSLMPYDNEYHLSTILSLQKIYQQLNLKDAFNFYLIFNKFRYGLIAELRVSWAYVKQSNNGWIDFNSRKEEEFVIYLEPKEVIHDNPTIVARYRKVSNDVYIETELDKATQMAVTREYRDENNENIKFAKSIFEESKEAKLEKLKKKLSQYEESIEKTKKEIEDLSK